VIELVDIPALVRLYRVWTMRLGRIYGPAARADFIAAVAAMCGVLVFDTLPGLFIGISMSLVLLLYRASRPNVAVLGRLPSGEWVDRARSDAAEPQAGVVVLRVEAGLFFANTDMVRKIVLAHAEGVRAVIIDAETIPFVDVTAADMLRQLSGELDAKGVKLLVARDIGQVRDVLRDDDEQQRLFPTVVAAVTQAR
jgi:SulP family sulfate permease